MQVYQKVLSFIKKCEQGKGLESARERALFLDDRAWQSLKKGSKAYKNLEE